MKTPKQLWAVKEPWTGREPDSAGTVARILAVKTASDSIRSMARGYRPPKLERFESLEREGTIIGGIQALAGAGISPWTDVDLDDLPKMRLIGSSPEPGASLKKIVKQVAQSLNDKRKINSVKDAAEFVRAQVIDSRLEKAAWYARGANLSALALQNQQVRSQVEGTTASALSLTGKALTATGVGAIIGLPIMAASQVASGMATRTKVEAIRSEAQVEEYANAFQIELEAWGARQQAKAAKEALALQLAESQESLRQAEAAGELTAKVVTGVISVSIIGGLSYAAYRFWSRA